MSGKKRVPGRPMPDKPINSDVAALTSVPRSTWTDPWLWMLLGITAIIYFKALGNGFTDLDDDYYIIKNQHLRDWSMEGLKTIFTTFYSFNYHPLTTLSNLVEFRMFGLNPLPYHLGNVLLHLCNTTLVFLFILKLCNNRVTAWIVAALFALHPMHVESVAWVAERKDVFYAAFYLAALAAYVDYVKLNRGARDYFLTLAWFACSLLSKSAAVTLPLVMLAIDHYLGHRLTLKSVLEKLPFFALSILFGILAIMSQRQGGAISDIMISYGLTNRIFVFFGGLAAYLGMLVVPYPLAAIHYFPNATGGVLPLFYYCSIPFVGGIAFLLTRKVFNKKVVIFGVMFFLVSISVMLQLVAVGAATFAERYTYIAYVGLFFIAATTIQAEAEKRGWIKYVGIAILAIYAGMTFQRIGIWQDTDTLFTDVVAKNEGNTHNSYFYWYWGNAKKESGDYSAAVDYFGRAISIDSGNYRAFASRGSIMEMQNNLNAALADYSRAIALDPTSARFRNYLGWALFEKGDSAGCMPQLWYAAKLDSGYSELFNNLGWIWFSHNNPDSAKFYYSKAIKCDHTALKPYLNRAALYAAGSKFAEAINDYDSIILYHPNDSLTYFNRGVVKINLNDTGGACDDWKKANQLGYTKAIGLIQLFCK